MFSKHQVAKKFHVQMCNSTEGASEVQTSLLMALSHSLASCGAASVPVAFWTLINQGPHFHLHVATVVGGVACDSFRAEPRGTLNTELLQDRSHINVSVARTTHTVSMKFTDLDKLNYICFASHSPYFCAQFIIPKENNYFCKSVILFNLLPPPIWYQFCV